jgi:DNA-binding MarR family transcriptional regulator
MPQTPDETRVSELAAELRVLVGKLKRRLQEQSQLGDLTWSQISVLAHLEREGPATISALARIEAMRPQSMGAIVSALEAAGHVIGAPDPNDGRQTIWSVTEACRAFITAGRAARQDWLFHAIEKTIPPERHDDLARAIDLLKRLVAA